MSIATALTALSNDVDAAKAAITAKGGTAPNGTSDMADAIASISTGGGSGSIVTGTFTLPSPTAGATINHNAHIDGEYIFLAIMQPASFEVLRASGSTQNYSVAFCVNCTTSLNDFTSGSAAAYVNKNGPRWRFTPSDNAFSGSMDWINTIVSNAGYDGNTINLRSNFGYHKGTYDFWAIPLN